VSRANPSVRWLQMRLANTPQRYGAVAILLHWGMAVLVIVLSAMGWYMVALPDVGYDREKITLILAHKALGIVALAAVALRLAWRLGNVLPQLAAGLPDWQQVAARFAHLLFYALLIALPLTGWLMTSAGGYPTPLIGSFELPYLVPVNEARFHLYIAVHRWLAYALLLLLAVHTVAALRHHLLLKDDSLRRMWPGG
jgi:cytochrome b561